MMINIGNAAYHHHLQLQCLSLQLRFDKRFLPSSSTYLDGGALCSCCCCCGWCARAKVQLIIMKLFCRGISRWGGAFPNDSTSDDQRRRLWVPIGIGPIALKLMARTIKTTVALCFINSMTLVVIVSLMHIDFWRPMRCSQRTTMVDGWNADVEVAITVENMSTIELLLQRIDDQQWLPSAN